MINYGITIPNNIQCLPKSMYVEKIEYGQRETAGGLILQREQMDMYGNFVRPRWAKVKYKSDDIEDINVGDWILIDHGHWSTSMKMNISGKDKVLWYISPKSYKNGVMAISKTMPEELKSYGIKDED